MKKILFTISSLIVATSLFIACSNEMDEYCAKVDQCIDIDKCIYTEQCIYTEYIELSGNISPDVKIKRIKEAERRILDNIRIIDGKISLSHITAEELLINPEYFEAMKFLLENCENAYEIITPKTRSTTLSSGENEQNNYFTQKDELADIITSLLESDLEKKLFLNYWYAKGDVVLTDSEWSGIKQYAETINKEFYSEITEVEISFYNNENYDDALGTAYISFLRNEAIGLTDTYDFNPLEFGKRTFKAELLTRYMNILGHVYDAKEFKIKYSSL